ncbi:hypothetical protein ACFWVM_28880 [Nocardia fluminea]|uniref:hypothetical protein n=1 Tax=Nocardia fluminea TaxID=134984 RepID=UPI0036694C0F
MAGSAGTTPIVKASIGTTPLLRISLGTTLLWDGQPFTAASAKLTSAHQTTTAWAQVLGFTADAAYPGSAVSSNSLVIPNAGSNVTLSASIPFSSGTSYAFNLTLQLYLNGVSVQTGVQASAPAFGSGTATVSISGMSVPAGSVLMLHARGGSQFNSGPNIAANANAYLRAHIP